MEKEQLKQLASAILREDGSVHAARTLTQIAFLGMKDRGGAPYFNHLERVAQGIADPRIKPIGYLHDLVEDVKGWDYQDLYDIGFDAFVVEGVRAVTKHDEDPYFDEMVRLSRTPQAIPVKKSDLADNMDLRRLPHVPHEKDIERTRKYYLAWHYLNDVEAGRCAPGTPFQSWMARQPAGKQDWALVRAYTAAGVAAPSQILVPRP